MTETDADVWTAELTRAFFLVAAPAYWVCFHDALGILAMLVVAAIGAVVTIRLEHLAQRREEQQGANPSGRRRPDAQLDSSEVQPRDLPPYYFF